MAKSETRRKRGKPKARAKTRGARAAAASRARWEQQQRIAAKIPKTGARLPNLPPLPDEEQVLRELAELGREGSRG